MSQDDHRYGYRYKSDISVGEMVAKLEIGRVMLKLFFNHVGSYWHHFFNQTSYLFIYSTSSFHGVLDKRIVC